MVLSKALRAGEGRMLKRLSNIANHINSIEGDFEHLGDAELAAKTDEFRERYSQGESLDDLLPEAFATAREAAKRVLGQRHFDVQVMGGAALHLGQVAEMKTGEGKTLTSVLPCYLNAISGDGVHVVTVNDYLAARDSEWMGRVHRFLGVTVGVVTAEQPPEQRREAYAADITYGTNNEFGFDYLRDNMALSLDECVQRGHNFAIVDEVDSILIDEARTPLIISGPAEQSPRWYVEFARLAPRMSRDTHYEVDERKRTVGVTELGVSFVEDQLGIENLYESANTPLVGYLNNAIKAKELFRKDKEYIVRGGEVLIVDEFTGRVLAGRRFNEGLHQALEAKENVEVQAENQTLATITLQNFFRLYDKLGGMTGTAQTEAAELHQTYKLGVVTIPTNRPMIRTDGKDEIYKTEEVKFEAVADDIAERYERGQPVLVGTTSVEHSEYLSKQLVKRNTPHEVLNAKYHDREATIVAEAGRKGAVTVATNMAGRGTDIVLGGNPELLAERKLRERGLDPEEHFEQWQRDYPTELERAKDDVRAEANEVIEAGGLYVLGTERHESRRIDNQLRGRSGRQGDPGESKFYLSLTDELMRRFNANLIENIMNFLNTPDDMAITSKRVTKAIQSAQTQVEAQNMEARKEVLKYDKVLNEQRKVIYTERRRVLEGEDLREQIRHMIDDVVGAYVHGATKDGYAEDWDLAQLWSALRTLYPLSMRHEELTDGVEDPETGNIEDLTPESLRELLVGDAKKAYERREAEIDGMAGEGAMRELERQVLLTVLDRKWREHLYEMDYLKQGISLRAMAQRDPVIEYQREGYDMFNGMLEALKEECVGLLFNLQVEAAEPEDGQEQATPVAVGADPSANAEAQAAPPALRGKGLQERQEPALTYSGPDEDGSAQSRSSVADEDEAKPAGGNRRERRAAERARAKEQKKAARNG